MMIVTTMGATHTNGWQKKLLLSSRLAVAALVSNAQPCNCKPISSKREINRFVIRVKLCFIQLLLITVIKKTGQFFQESLSMHAQQLPCINFYNLWIFFTVNVIPAIISLLKPFVYVFAFWHLIGIKLLINDHAMQQNNHTVTPAEENIISTPAEQYINNTVAMDENNDKAAKEKIEEEVKGSFAEENIPVEPVLGDDGVEVGGEG